MATIDMSLDDIIKKNLVKTNVPRGWNGPRKTNLQAKKGPELSGRVTKPNINNKPFNKVGPTGLNNSRGRNNSGPQPKVNDARIKIIQKKRLKLTDARQKLSEIAKKTDARQRIEKLRQSRGTRQYQIGTTLRGQTPIHEENLLQRTIRGRGLSSGLRDYEDDIMEYADDLSYTVRNFPDRTMDTDLYDYQYRNRYMDKDHPLIYRTVENDLPLSRLYQDPEYFWANAQRPPSPILIEDSPPHTTMWETLRSDRQSPSLIIERNGSRKEAPSSVRSDATSWEYDDPPIVITKKVKPIKTVGILKRTTTNYPDKDPIRVIRDSPPTTSKTTRTLNERFCQDSNSVPKLSQQLKSRLDSPQTGSRCDTSGPVGHRIVVSNLVASVTHEDVKELFEDIGELLSSKVVRPGTAEVVYKLHKDAVKAVDVYHNRQLDGQPMKCLLVNNRTSLQIPPKRILEKKGKSNVELDMNAFRKALHKKSTS